MRGSRLLTSALIALALGGCMQQRQPTYYMVDPATGRMVPLARSTMPPAYAATYGQQSYASVSPQPAYSLPMPQQPEMKVSHVSEMNVLQQPEMKVSQVLEMNVPHCP